MIDYDMVFFFVSIRDDCIVEVVRKLFFVFVVVVWYKDVVWDVSIWNFCLLVCKCFCYLYYIIFGVVGVIIWIGSFVVIYGEEF